MPRPSAGPCYPVIMRWILVASLTVGFACERPRVLPSANEAGPEVVADAAVLLSQDEIEAVAKQLAKARNAGDAEALAALYEKDAKALRWNGESSWSYQSKAWTSQLVGRRAAVELESAQLLRYGTLERLAVIFDEKTEVTHYQTLSIYELSRSSGRLLVAKETELGRLDLRASPLSSFSKAVLADLSYRPEPEIAFLRSKGHSFNNPKLDPKALSGASCPSESCKSESTVDLVLLSPEGDKRLDTNLLQFKGPCLHTPAVELSGAIPVYERDALLVERGRFACGGDGTYRNVAVIGVRGTDTKELLTIERSRVIEVDQSSITVEHVPSAGAQPKVIRFVPNKEEERLTFRAEPRDDAR